MAELRARRDTVVGADLVELRLDTTADPDAAAALEGRRTPVIVTCRPQWEGGQFAGSEEERHRILGDAIALGAEYVDIEWRAQFTDLIERTRGRGVVLSTHDFDGVPRDLCERAAAMRATGADVIKLAAKANRLSDCIPLMELGSAMNAGGRAVIVAMGDRGLPSRVLARKFCSAWTYTGMLGGIGQVAAHRLAGEYRFHTLGASTRVYGLVGSPVGHSVSPAMHNAAFEAAAIDAVYLPLDAADADDFTAFARAFDLSGASVTIPFKVALFDRVHEADAAANQAGALNTIRIDEGRWLGRNTDVNAFLAPLIERSVPLQGARAAILGAGGAARAVAMALAPGGTDITVHARNRNKARDVAAIGGGRVGDLLPEAGSWDLLVNCTPVGMHPNVDATPVPCELLSGGLVYDLIYNPTETRLLREAARLGRQTIGGLDMLVAQAEEQFHWWTGTRPPSGVMRRAAVKRLSEMSES